MYSSIVEPSKFSPSSLPRSKGSCEIGQVMLPHRKELPLARDRYDHHWIARAVRRVDPGKQGHSNSPHPRSPMRSALLPSVHVHANARYVEMVPGYRCLRGDQLSEGTC